MTTCHSLIARISRLADGARVPGQINSRHGQRTGGFAAGAGAVAASAGGLTTNRPARHAWIGRMCRVVPMRQERPVKGS